MPDMPLLGEPLAIELANTVVATEEGPMDLLRSDADVRTWIGAHRDELPEGASEHPPSLSALRDLRDAVRELLDAALAQGPGPARALDRVNAASGAAAPRPILEWDDEGPHRSTRSTSGARASRVTLGAVARSAIEVLGGPQGRRLRRCEGPGCILYFVATNPRRRWCSPATCGNRVRVARHYARHREP